MQYGQKNFSMGTVLKRPIGKTTSLIRHYYRKNPREEIEWENEKWKENDMAPHSFNKGKSPELNREQMNITIGPQQDTRKWPKKLKRKTW